GFLSWAHAACAADKPMIAPTTSAMAKCLPFQPSIGTFLLVVAFGPIFNWRWLLNPFAGHLASLNAYPAHWPSTPSRFQHRPTETHRYSLSMRPPSACQPKPRAVDRRLNP